MTKRHARGSAGAGGAGVVKRARQRIDEEFAGEHGTTVSQRALDDEAHPDGPGDHGFSGVARKVVEEAAEGDGLLDKVRRAAHELDRDIAGEYEHREDRGGSPRASDQATEQEADRISDANDKATDE